MTTSMRVVEVVGEAVVEVAVEDGEAAAHAGFAPPPVDLDAAALHVLVAR